MFSTLKNIFRGLVENDNNKALFEKPSEFEIRVDPFDEGNSKYYCIRYYDGFSWFKLCNPLTPREYRGKVDSDRKWHPFLDTFDKCVQLASKFQTLQDVHDYHNKVFTEWDTKAKILSDQIFERKSNLQTWSSKNP